MSPHAARPAHPDVAYDLVIPTIGRDSLDRLLQALAEDLDGPDPGTGPRSVIVVDDRPPGSPPLDARMLHLPVQVVCSGGRGPAAARNRGWRHSTAPWVCFLDDDVVIRPSWSARLTDDLVHAPGDVAAVQGDVHVPLPDDRRPTDRERNVAGLATARWITADMALRRTALAEVGGFDERFPRAYREDSDLALRLMDAGWRLAAGTRQIDHPVGAAGWDVTIRQQRGNADDALMRRLHGADWRDRAGAPRGSLRQHVVASVSLTGAAAALGARRPRAAAALGAAWALQWGRFSWKRIAPGPRTAEEVAAMAATSAAIPLAATWWAVTGKRRSRRLAPAGPADRWGTRRPQAVFFDRDATLVDDVPYNGDPALVRPVPGALEALDRLRAAGMRIAMVSNQSGVARGMLTPDQVRAVNARIVELLGPFDAIRWCPHGPDDACACRKPAPGMLEDAARALGVAPTACAMVGDIGADVDAGLAAGARAVLVPTPVTRDDEVADAPEVGGSLPEAVDALLGGLRLPAGHQAQRRDRQPAVGERAS
jgi:histidinol-phosphate phosphatase family protein